MNKMQKILGLAICLVLLLCACSPADNNAQVQTFTDDLGRQVSLPATIDSVAPSGNPSQILLYTLAPQKMAGWARLPADSQAKYIPEQYLALPEFGAFYGKSGNFNSEALVAASPDLVVDFGERKEGIAEDLDRLQEKIGIPVIFIEGDIDKMGNAYRKLGTLLGVETRAELLASYCENAIEDVSARATSVSAVKSVYYGEGERGLEAISSGNVHGRVIEMIGAVNVATSELNGGTGANIIDGEQLLTWQPDILIFNPPLAYDYAKENTLFTSLNKPMYQVPEAMYNWMGRPPSINQLLGLYWLGNVVYPDIYDIDIDEKAKEFYTLFFDYEISDEELATLLKNN